MQKLAKINDHNDLVKDVKSGAVLLSDKTAVNDYLSRKKMLNANRNANEEINILKEKVEKIDKIENDLAEIKELLKGLTNR